MGKVTFDYSKAAPFIGADEVKFMEAQAAAVKDVLLKRTGAGNDFLGWIDLPVNYDREEFARIQKAAAAERYFLLFRHSRITVLPFSADARFLSDGHFRIPA